MQISRNFWGLRKPDGEISIRWVGAYIQKCSINGRLPPFLKYADYLFYVYFLSAVELTSNRWSTVSFIDAMLWCYIHKTRRFYVFRFTHELTQHCRAHLRRKLNKQFDLATENSQQLNRAFQSWRPGLSYIELLYNTKLRTFWCSKFCCRLASIGYLPVALCLPFVNKCLC